MTEEQAIKRIAAAIRPVTGVISRKAGQLAWNEMKAIVREDTKRQDNLIAEAVYRDRHELYWMPEEPGTKA